MTDSKPKKSQSAENKPEKLDRLKKQREILNARISKMEAAEKTKQRKRETRMKILIGHYYMEQAKKDDAWQKLCEVMRDYLKRDSDKALFAASV